MHLPLLRDHRARLGAVLTSTLFLLATGVLPALAHGGVVPQPVIEQLPRGLDGLEAVGTVAFSPRILVTNPDADPLTVVDDSGRPWLQISADGVLADLTVRAWYESLDPTGRGVDPAPDAPSGWTKVSVLPRWEWFDTDLLPRAGDDDDHSWSIPVVVDGAFDEISGTLEEAVLEGRWGTDLVSSPDIGAARLTAVSGPVPVFVVQLLDAEEVVVLGRDGEPMVRLTAAGFEANRASPTWMDHARLDTSADVGVIVEDPNAEPVWEMRLDGAPTATWLDTRGTTGDVVPGSRDDVALEFTVPIVVDGERFDVAAVTTWAGDQPPVLGLRLTWPALIALSLASGLLAAAAVRLWERRRTASDDAADALSSPTPAAAGPAPFETRFAEVLGTTMAYWDEGEGDPIVLLHGNPTSKLLWRDVVPHLTGLGRVIVPDLVGMGESAPLPGTGDERYRFTEHARHLFALLEQLGVERDVTLVLHDWGGGLGFHWADTHRDAVRGIAFTETICGPVSLQDWPEGGRELFAAMRSDAGEQIVLEKNVFVERILPSSVLGEIPDEVMAAYAAPYLEPGESRRPTLTWPRQIPFDGEPSDVAAIVASYAEWLATDAVPKLHLPAEPGFLTQVYGERVAGWQNLTQVPIAGIHFVQEDSGDAIGRAVAAWISGLA